MGYIYYWIRRSEIKMRIHPLSIRGGATIGGGRVSCDIGGRGIE